MVGRAVALVGRRTVEGTFQLGALGQQGLAAAQRLDMIMAYFAPRNACCAKSGGSASVGEARLVFAAKSDNNATIGATRSLYDYLLRRQHSVGVSTV
jgi:hypothetical protein